MFFFIIAPGQQPRPTSPHVRFQEPPAAVKGQDKVEPRHEQVSPPLSPIPHRNPTVKRTSAPPDKRVVINLPNAWSDVSSTISLWNESFYKDHYETCSLKTIVLSFIIFASCIFSPLHSLKWSRIDFLQYHSKKLYKVNSKKMFIFIAEIHSATPSTSIVLAFYSLQVTPNKKLKSSVTC